MEGKPRSSPSLDSPMESDDVKYVSGLSTVLVATIQEVKDRVSQIEYIFCSQLYPDFQSKLKLRRKIYSEARKALDEEWKEKENDLLVRIERLEREKERTLEENRSLRLEIEGCRKESVTRVESQQLRVDELEASLRSKCEEVDEGLKLHRDLLQMIQLKSSEIASGEKQLKEEKEKMSDVLANLIEMDKRVKTLQKVVGDRNEEVAKGKELAGNLFKKIESQASEIVSTEQVLRDREKEKQILTDKLKCLEETARLYEESEREKKLLVDKVNGLEEKVNELRADLRARSDDVTKEHDLYLKAIEEVESKAAECVAEKRKRRDVFDAFKRLKSQYNFLLEKSGLCKQNMISPVKSQDESDSVKSNPNQITLVDREEDRDQDSSPTICDITEAKSKITVENTLDKTDAFRGALKCRPTVKPPASLSGIKRSASLWRETRTHQGKNGSDPHDDFLDTPMENIRGNINKATRDDLSDRRALVLPRVENDDGCSDDETQDMNADKNPLKIGIPVPATSERKGFKFIEPVRKKAERENLKGVECKQCKKFYDAVLCNDDGNNGGDGKYSHRCEHHEGVSRHRYRYVPPSTPEGFWNIGFESEI